MVDYLCWTGGLDSTCLLLLLRAARGAAPPPRTLYLTHVDQRQNADLEVERMLDIAAVMGLPPPRVERAPPLPADIADEALAHHRLGLSTRPVHQYAYLEAWLRLHGATAWIGAVQGDGISRAWSHPRHGASVRALYRHLRLPLRRAPKRALLRALLPENRELLERTISCWHPLDRHGTPCARCPMCRARPCMDTWVVARGKVS